MESVDTDASFVYNENGLRVQKTVNGEVTNYTLHGKNIVHMTKGNDDLHFFYDASNKPAIVEYNGTKYAYVHNLQGDIVAILDSTGAVVVSYVYDAWGRPISCSGTMVNTLGKINPFRYRGYVYDEETGIYYLQSRYYASDWKRFVNADTTDMLDANGDVWGNRQYLYCNNDPINRTDPYGLWSWSSILDTACKVIGTVAVVASAAAIIVGTGGTAATFVFGAACGGLIGGYFNEKAGGHYFSGFIGGSVSSLVQSIAGKFSGALGTWLGGAGGSGLGTFIAGTLDNLASPESERKSDTEILAASAHTAVVALSTSAITAYMSSGFTYALKSNGLDGLMVGMDEAFANMGSQFFGSVDDAATYVLVMKDK
ncbi:MAG: RHS repeat-associated core domain-containing protein [Faecousia sp.]